MKLLHSLLIAQALAILPAAAQAPPVPQAPQAQQPPPAATTPRMPAPDMSNAYQTRQLFQQLLRQYPPFLSEVVDLDPSLLTNQTFLNSYPNLAEFLAQHPEIIRNPGFFAGNDGYRNRRLNSPEERSQEMMENILAGIAAFTSGLIFVSVFCWVVKTAVDHRRWVRVAKVQSEVHTKLLDRFTSNQDLLAYIQTPAGKHFLESAPISLDPVSRVGAPMNRILFSVQAGVILAFAGIGLHMVGRTLLVQEIAQPIYVIGALALALGIGFVLSAFIAYAMSRRLGLLHQTPLASTSASAGASPPNA